MTQKFFFDPNYFWNQIFFDPTCFLPKTFFDPIFFQRKIVCTQNLFGPKIFFEPKIILDRTLFWTQDLFDPYNFFLHKYFWQRIFSDKNYGNNFFPRKFLYHNFVHPRFILPGIFMKKDQHFFIQRLQYSLISKSKLLLGTRVWPGKAYFWHERAAFQRLSFGRSRSGGRLLAMT